MFFSLQMWTFSVELTLNDKDHLL